MEEERLKAINILSNSSLGKKEVLEELSEVLNVSITPKEQSLEDNNLKKEEPPKVEEYKGIYDSNYVRLVEEDMQNSRNVNLSQDIPENLSYNFIEESDINETNNGKESSKVISLTKTLTNPNAPSGYHYEGATSPREDFSEFQSSSFIPFTKENDSSLYPKVDRESAPNIFAGASTVSPEDFASFRRAA